MKANYKKIAEIQLDVQRTQLEEFLKFDSRDRYGFFKCEECGGPILGHIEPKCRGLNGARYDAVTVKSMEDWLERIPEFQHAVKERIRKKEDEKYKRKTEVWRMMIKNQEPRNPNNQAATSQLIKARWPPV